ncbi:GTPase-activating protein gyp3 [Tolypocladium ophioglossoides CBS 100239]|uniref:GTPase-activating protein gyp3 n=1 Tax=Tolypocladium ophioglossoides (strain CBS 100239) TaxID=1163406 RepID=A0A0L0N681_TOLOC|nr:GTPase-activating protein gyp3 [Tolypocladium ophioglossoides CBS 100239]
MAIPRRDENGPVEGQRSVHNRQCSVYASRIKPTVSPLALDSTSAVETVERMPQLPHLPPLPVSPRWDSLSHGSLVSPMRAAFGPAQQTRDALARTPEPRSDSPSMPLTTKSSLAEVRLPDGVAVENFSRPRKQSIRQPLAQDQGAALEPARPRLANIPPSDPLLDIASSTPQTPPWQRPRRPSASSCKSASTLSSPLAATAGDFVEPRPSRARNATGPPLTSAARLQFAASRVDGTASAPVASGAPPWMAGDELRSSFRSQLTTSTTLGTALTERSSVLTKGSSVTSLDANPDEPSLEDVMGMYEKGFADDEDDDENEVVGAIGAGDSDGFFGPHTVTATLLAGGPGVEGNAALPETDLTSPFPTARSTLDAEIRQSRMIFTSPAFTSSVPAISGDADLSTTEKRDSGKSLDSEPSVTSDPTATTGTKTIITSITSPPSASASPSPSPCPSTSPSPSPAPPMAEEPEDPGSRDRYGFKKQSQLVTREQYDAWNKGYSLYLARRRKKWVAYLKDCALMTDRPIRFPSANAKTKRFVRKGIPPDWRGAAWFYYAGGPAILAKHSGLYEKLLHKQAKEIDVEAIERDLHRTFPDNIQFKPSASFETALSSGRASQSTMTGSTSDESSLPGPVGAEGEPPIITSMRRVLHAFSVYNPRIGYCQSLNFLAGLLLLFVETEEQCFWLLNVITIIYLPGTHEMNLEGSKVDLGVLMTELRDTMPAVWDKIGGELEGNPNPRPSTSKSIRKPMPMLRRRELPNLSTERLPPITLCMTAWFMSCYIGTLPIETTLRVWDVFFYEGSKTLFRIALVIFKSGESEIKAVSDPMEMFGVVQSLPRRMLDANALMEACFKRRNGFGHLSQGAIDDRRQERREKAQQERTEQLQRGKTATSGNVTEVEAEPVHRMGTLFGRKRRDFSKPRAAEA